MEAVLCQLQFVVRFRLFQKAYTMHSGGWFMLGHSALANNQGAMHYPLAAHDWEVY